MSSEQGQARGFRYGLHVHKQLQNESALFWQGEQLHNHIKVYERIYDGHEFRFMSWIVMPAPFGFLQRKPVIFERQLSANIYIK